MPEHSEHTYQTVKAKDVVLKDNYRFFYKSKIIRFFSKLLASITAIFTIIIAKLIYGLKIKGYKNLKKGGGVIISNHMLPMDAFITTSTFIRRRVWVTSLQSNLGLPFGFGKFIRIMAMVPIPDKISQLKQFKFQLNEVLNKGEYVVVYPEAVLLPYADHIRDFKKGAFYFALSSNKPLYPIVYTYRKRKGLRKLLGKKPLITLNILPQYNVKEMSSNNETIQNALNETHKIMTDFFNTHSEIKKEN